MRRREFITLLGGAATWPFAARAQQPAMPVIGFMSARSPEDSEHLLAAFRRGLGESGFIEGRNVAVEYRWARGDYARLPALAAELVNRRVAVLLGVGGDASARAAKAATSTIPIVFGMGSDPVAAGMVASLNRPGSNVTGVSVLTNEMEPKRLGLLHELVSGTTLVGALLTRGHHAPGRFRGMAARGARAAAGNAGDWVSQPRITRYARPLFCADFTGDCGTPDMSRARTSRSYTGGRAGNSTSCRHWRPSWFAERWP
jgi:ABC transporter substrate binding protein